MNRYMKYYSNSTLSWGEDGTGDNVKVPIPLPRVTKVWKQEVGCLGSQMINLLLINGRSSLNIAIT